MRNSEGQKSGKHFFLTYKYSTLIFFVVDEDIDYLTLTKSPPHTSDGLDTFRHFFKIDILRGFDLKWAKSVKLKLIR